MSKMRGTSVYWPQKCPKKLTFQGVIRSVDAVEDFLVNELARPSEGVERLFCDFEISSDRISLVC